MTKAIPLILQLMLILSLGLFTWFANAPKTDSDLQSPPKPAEIFGINCDLSSGWNRKVMESRRVGNNYREVVEFLHPQLTIKVATQLFPVPKPNPVYTGYDPTLSEVMTVLKDKKAVFIGEKDGKKLGRVEVSSGKYQIIDLDSKQVFGNQVSYEYEMPIIIKYPKFITKTTIIYMLKDSKSLGIKSLSQADSIALNLHATYGLSNPDSI